MSLKRLARGALALFIGLLLGGTVAVSYAGTVAYKFNGMNVTREGGATYFRGTSPSEVAAAGVSVNNHVISAAGSANWYSGTGALLQSGGVVFNAAIPIASTAAAIAVTAVRANPAGLITTAIASHLLSLGLEYVNGQFVKTVSSGSPVPVEKWYAGSTVHSDPEQLCYSYGPANYGYQSWYWSPSNATSGACRTPEAGHWGFTVNRMSTCGQDGGQHVAAVNGACQVTSTSQPAVDSDWAAARAGHWSDPAYMDLVRKGVPLPTDKPVFTPTSKDVPLSDPVVDPVTGKRMQDIARITPQPTAPDTADVQVTKQEVDANGQPVVVNGAPVAPVDDSDLCKKNPGIIACMQGDIPEGPDLTNTDKNVTITPDSGWGPDNGSCPADRTTTLHGGVQYVQSWQPACYAVTTFRPALLAVAWFTAVLIAIGIYRSNA